MYKANNAESPINRPKLTNEKLFKSFIFQILRIKTTDSLYITQMKTIERLQMLLVT